MHRADMSWDSKAGFFVGWDFLLCTVGIYVEAIWGLGIRVEGLEFPKLRETILGVPIIRIAVFWDPNWGPPII